MFKKILYIGAGLHLDPIKHFNNTKQFLFVDSNPRNEYGYDYYYRGFYRDMFLSQLKDIFLKMNFKNIDNIVLTNNYSEILVDNLDPTKMSWILSENNLSLQETRVDYYYSVGIPNDLYNLHSLIKEIGECDTVLVAGHHPHSFFVEFMKKPFHFVGYTDTYFPKNYSKLIEEDSEDKNNIIAYILEHPSSVIDYTLVNKNTGEKQIYKSYSEFYINLRNN